MTIRKVLCAFLAVLLFASGISGCRSAQTREISCADVVQAYEESGFAVFHEEDTLPDTGEVCCVRAEDKESGEYIYFHFFETEEQAKACAERHAWNVVLWLYSVACWQPTWLTTKTYKNVEYEYCDSALVKPFQKLIG